MKVDPLDVNLNFIWQVARVPCYLNTEQAAVSFKSECGRGTMLNYMKLSNFKKLKMC